MSGRGERDGEREVPPDCTGCQTCAACALRQQPPGHLQPALATAAARLPRLCFDRPRPAAAARPTRRQHIAPTPGAAGGWKWATCSPSCCRQRAAAACPSPRRPAVPCSSRSPTCSRRAWAPCVWTQNAPSSAWRAAAMAAADGSHPWGTRGMPRPRWQRRRAARSSMRSLPGSWACRRAQHGTRPHACPVRQPALTPGHRLLLAVHEGALHACRRRMWSRRRCACPAAQSAARPWQRRRPEACPGVPLQACPGPCSPRGG